MKTNTSFFKFFWNMESVGLTDVLKKAEAWQILFFFGVVT